MKRLKVTHYCMSLGLGGIQKTVELLVTHLDKNRFDPCVIYFGGDDFRRSRIEAAGIRVYSCHGSVSSLHELLSKINADILHIHFDDLAEIENVLNQITSGDLIVVGTSVFGHITHDLLKSVERIYYVSQFVAHQAQLKLNLGIDRFWKKNRVLFNPVVLSPPDAGNVKAFREHLGIEPETFVIGRISRAVPEKFGLMLLDMYPYLHRINPTLKYLIVGVPEALNHHPVLKRFSDQIIVLPEIKDETELQTYYHSINLLVHSSQAGETFGMVVAEAMAAGKPVVVDKTPFHANAQIEIVDHAINGYVAHTPGTFAQSISSLASDSGRYAQFASRAHKKAADYYDVTKIVGDLQRDYIFLSDPHTQDPILLVTNHASQTVSMDDFRHYVSSSKKRLKAGITDANLVARIHYNAKVYARLSLKVLRKMFKSESSSSTLLVVTLTVTFVAFHWYACVWQYFWALKL